MAKVNKVEKKDTEYTMFEDYVKNEHPDLYKSARTFEIDLGSLNGLYQYVQNEAVLSLKRILKNKQKETAQVDHVEQFMAEHKDVLHDYTQALERLVQELVQYNTENDTDLAIRLDAKTDNDIIYMGRPRGKPKVPLTRERDLATFAQKAKERGYSVDRIRILVDGEWRSARLNEKGHIVDGDQTFDQPNKWRLHVFANAKGEKSTSGSPWKAIKIADKKGDYRTLELAYSEVMER